MSRKNLMLAMAGMLAIASDPFMSRTGYSTPTDKKPKTKEKLHDYMWNHPPKDSRQLREFSIKGNKVMAYSKKDAITRLKHQKKI